MYEIQKNNWHRLSIYAGTPGTDVYKNLVIKQRTRYQVAW